MVKAQTPQAFPGLQARRSHSPVQPTGEKPKGQTVNFLSVFSEVREGESISALLLMVAVFLLLGAYYLLKPVREALILSESGAEAKSYSAAGQAVLLLGVIPLYGWVASRVNRVRLLTGLTLFFASNLALFCFLGHRGLRLGIVFSSGWAFSVYLWFPNSGHSPTTSTAKNRASGFSRSSESG